MSVLKKMNEIVHKFVAKLHKYKILFKDILLLHTKGHTSLMILYLVVLRTIIPKITGIGKSYHIKTIAKKINKSLCFKGT